MPNDGFSKLKAISCVAFVPCCRVVPKVTLEGVWCKIGPEMFRVLALLLLSLESRSGVLLLDKKCRKLG